MMRFIRWFAALLLAVLCMAAPAMAEARTQYRADIVQLDAATYQVHCEAEYTNPADMPVTGVVFALYANQLRRESSLVATDDLLEATFPGGYAPGGVEFAQITVNGEAADWGMQGEKELFLRVACDLQPGETAVFAFDYRLLLIYSRGELGFGEKDVRLSGFLPCAALWDTDGYAVNDTSALDRYALHPAADYEISLTAGDAYAVAAAGTMSETGHADGRRTWRIGAQGVRDMAVALSVDCRETMLTSAQGTQVRLLGQDRAGMKRAAKTAQAAIDLLESWLGKAPYPVITLLQADMANDGACFGGMAWIPTARYDGRQKAQLERDVVYRLAQQYFGMGAGNDPVQAPWLSVSVPEMLWYQYVEAREGRGAMLEQLNADCLSSLLMTLPGGYTVDSALNLFTDAADYETVVRRRGAAAMYLIREAMGQEIFLNGLRHFYEMHNGGMAGLREFVAAFNDVGGREYDLLIVDTMYTMDDYQGVMMDWFE